MIRRVPIPGGAQRQRLPPALAGIPEPIAGMNAQAFSMIADGDAAWVTEDVPRLLGRPARSFRQFATDYAPAFS